MSLIRVPYDFRGNLKFVSYASIENRVKNFSQVENIGKDASGQYNMYAIHMGQDGKPPIMVHASMHGTEWHGAVYAMDFMEQLRDDTFPDHAFRAYLLQNYKIIHIPVVNPWGFDNTTEYENKSRNLGRANSNGVDLNRDYSDFTQAESQNVKKIIDREKPFAFIDLHMFSEGMDGTAGKKMIIGNGQYTTNHIRDLIGNSWERVTNEPAHRWDGYDNLSSGLARRYVRDTNNPWTPETLSYIIEMKRTMASESVVWLTYDEIRANGMAVLYLFFKTSMMYYEQRKVELTIPQTKLYSAGSFHNYIIGY